MKNIVLLFIVFFTFSSCKKKEFDIKNLNGDKVGVLGHGGMGIGHTYPMNSLESILNCLNLGADGTEIDVQMTKDGVLVAYHDLVLEKKTNLTGQLNTKTWAEIKDAQYLNPQYGNYKIIRLDDIFKNISNPNKFTFFLDCKIHQPPNDSTFLNTFNHELINFIDKYDLVKNIFIEYDNEDNIKSLQDIRPDIRLFIYTSYELAITLIEQYNLHGISIAVDQLTSKRVEYVHNIGAMISTFNTHSRKRNIEAVELNVDFIQTDRLKHLIKILK